MMESRLHKQLGWLEFSLRRARLWRRLAVCWAATAGVELVLFLTATGERKALLVARPGRRIDCGVDGVVDERRRPAEFHCAGCGHRTGIPRSPPFACDGGGAGAASGIRLVWVSANARHRGSPGASAHDFMGGGNCAENFVGEEHSTRCAGRDAGCVAAGRQSAFVAGAIESRVGDGEGN